MKVKTPSLMGLNPFKWLENNENEPKISNKNFGYYSMFNTFVDILLFVQNINTSLCQLETMCLLVFLHYLQQMDFLKKLEVIMILKTLL
jgi:hypothetical protein